jgi:hypothetical protein
VNRGRTATKRPSPNKMIPRTSLMAELEFLTVRTLDDSAALSYSAVPRRCESHLLLPNSDKGLSLVERRNFSAFCSCV